MPATQPPSSSAPPASAAAPFPLLPAVEIESGSAPTFSVIWLHGLGADGHDFEPVVDALELEGLPPIRFVFPHAPMRPVTINNGYVMRAWYDIVSADFSQRREDPAGVRESARQVEALIAREVERGVAERDIVLAGFSQGGAIALHAGLRRARPLAGILALSTYVPLADSLTEERHEASRQVPIFMAHGRVDTVIPYTFGEQSYRLLRDLGHPAEWHGYPAGHTVIAEELRDIETWLRRIVADRQP